MSGRKEIIWDEVARRKAWKTAPIPQGDLCIPAPRSNTGPGPDYRTVLNFKSISLLTVERIKDVTGSIQLGSHTGGG